MPTALKKMALAAAIKLQPAPPTAPAFRLRITQASAMLPSHFFPARFFKSLNGIAIILPIGLSPR